MDNIHIVKQRSTYGHLWTTFSVQIQFTMIYVCFHKEHILSDWMSIRHYCLTQLRTVWLHMGMNFLSDDEERSFFITRSMYTLFMVCLLFPVYQLHHYVY